MKVNIAQLKAAVAALNNEINGHDSDAPAVYQLDGAYGGWKLVKLPGHSDVFHSGYVSKPVLYGLVWAMVEGARAVKEG